MRIIGKGYWSFVALIGVAAAAGCMSAPPPRYYTLDMRASGGVKPAIRIVVDRLQPAEALVRQEIMIQTTPTQVEYYAADQWAASVSELVSRKLEAEFGAPGDGARTVLLSGSILDFEQVDVPGGAEGYVKLAAAFHNGGGSRYDTPLLEKAYEARVPADAPTAEAVVRALSQALAGIAAEIARDADAL